MSMEDDDSPNKRLKIAHVNESNEDISSSHQHQDPSQAGDYDDATNTTTTSIGIQPEQHPPLQPPQLPKRKLRSVFSSNQAIHNITAKHVAANITNSETSNVIPMETNGADAGVGVGVSVGGETSNVPIIENTNSNTNDDDAANEDDTEDEDEEIQVTGSNMTNPMTEFPHPRHLCGMHPFDAKFTNSNHKICDKCYCFVCDIPASRCLSWVGNHCHAYNSTEWTSLRKLVSSSQNDVIVLDDDDDDDGNNEMTEEQQRQQRRLSIEQRKTHQARLAQRLTEKYGRNTNTEAVDLDNGVPSPTRSELEEMEHNGYHEEQENNIQMNHQHQHQHPHEYRGRDGSGMEPEPEQDATMIGQKQRKDARITEVLAHNMRLISNLSLANASTANRTGNGSGNGSVNGSASDAEGMEKKSREESKMEGDIPQLNLHKSFFVEGVRIGWPYPLIMQPQRQMAIHLVKAFKNKKHVVLESPTGTGKSAAILCAALAWQRYDAKRNEFGETTKIIYCSRTHSQVAQMVSSLKKTPYRPRMAILGSRDRLCIHKNIRPRNNVNESVGGGNGVMVRAKKKVFGNINTQCQARVRNTEKFRKTTMNSRFAHYDDDSPPVYHAGDGDDDGGVSNNNNDSDDEGEGQMSKASHKMCPHYRQLSSQQLAAKVHSEFIPEASKTNCCSMGGAETKLGAHDIEDLCKFGAQPNIKRGVALYREPSVPSFGLQLSQKKGTVESISVQGISPSGAAKKEGSIEAGDTIMSVNEQDVSGGYALSQVTKKIKETKDPLLLDLYRGESPNIDTDEYSNEAACPYYLSRALAKGADIVFCPYNYVLDPNIRAALELKVQDAIVVLDEAHNVEDTMRNMGSGKYGEIECVEMMALLNTHASQWEPRNQRLSFGGREDESLKDKVPEIAHDLLLFVERIIKNMRESRERFENNQGRVGVNAASEEYRKFKCPDDKEFELRYFGPTSVGDGKNPIGCKSYFDLIGTNTKEIKFIESQLEQFNDYMQSKRGNKTEMQRNNTIAERLYDLLSTLCSAFRLSEHFYTATVVSANGNLDFATDSEENSNFRRFKRNPKPYPQFPVASVDNPHHRPKVCHHPSCNKKSKGTISHNTYCDGTTPKWESHLVVNLLTPGVLMAPLLKETRSVVLASGSLAPLQSLCAELHLLPPEDSKNTAEKKVPISQSQKDSEKDLKEEKDKDPLSTTSGRLQSVPKPLEANHVVNLPKQLLALGIGHFPDGTPLKNIMSNYSRPGYFEKLGNAISSIIEAIPRGGVLVFFPSFSFLRKCVAAWQDDSTWDRLYASKGEVVVEPPGSSQAEFEKAKNTFNGTVERTNNCILLAVFRGKMSEGVSFNDDYARGVICVGVPLPSNYDRSISAKKAYNDEQRKFRKKQLLSGREWYSQQAYRAIAQAIGRCIRHAADYGTIILLDSRHCDDGHYNASGIPQVHSNLPKWMRHSVRTLRMDRRQRANNDVLGGWRGLKNEMQVFFREAPIHCDGVLKKQGEDFQRMQTKGKQSELAFDRKTGKWSSSSTKNTKQENGTAHTFSQPSFSQSQSARY